MTKNDKKIQKITKKARRNTNWNYKNEQQISQNPTKCIYYKMNTKNDTWKYRKKHDASYAKVQEIVIK